MNLAQDLQRTRAFLLELLGVPRRPDEELRAQAAAVDWRVALQLAGPGLLPMMAWRLSQRRVDAPSWVRERCRRAYRASAAMLVRRRAAMRTALAAIDQAGIEAVVLKGLALAHQVYPSPETRPMSDVDLWVRRDTVARTIAALTPLGWRQPWWREKGPASADSGEIGLMLSPGSLMIELHGDPCSLVEAAPQALEAIWSCRKRTSLGDLPAWTLPVEATLVHLALHLADHHRFLDAIGRLLDVALLIDAAGRTIEWPAFAGRCDSLGVSRWVATVLAASQAMLGAPLPPGALAAFQVGDLDGLCAMAAEQAWRVPQAGQAPSSILSGATPGARAARMRRRIVWLFEPAYKAPRSRTRHLFHRLRTTAQIMVPAFLRALWLNLTRPAEGVRLRQWAAENDALVRALRGHPAAAAR